MMLEIECIGGPMDGDVVQCLHDRLEAFDWVIRGEQPTIAELCAGARLRLGRYELRTVWEGEQYVWVGEVDPE